MPIVSLTIATIINPTPNDVLVIGRVTGTESNNGTGILARAGLAHPGIFSRYKAEAVVDSLEVECASHDSESSSLLA